MSKNTNNYDTVTICPYCGSQARGGGCCGESSAHFETHYCVFTNKYDFDFVNPTTGEFLDEACDESRVA
jgi:hypothetical protein